MKLIQEESTNNSLSSGVKIFCRIILQKFILRRQKILARERGPRTAREVPSKGGGCGSVVILVNENVPVGAVSVLGKGLGFIPTPKPDDVSTRLDMRLLTNNITNASRAKLFPSASSQTAPYKIPPKLRRTIYSKSEPTWDKCVQDSVQKMTSTLDDKLRTNDNDRYKCTNLSNAEQEGLKWLQKKISENNIAIVQADKGGAILVVTPELLRRKTLEKLNNTDLYEKIEQDPTKELHKELVNLWIHAKSTNIVTAREAKDVMGISDNAKADESGPTNRLSTLPHYRPGKAYFYPSLKIHKCKKEDLKPGVEPPIRLITALQDGISKR
jgi:hypothetical protein